MRIIIVEDEVKIREGMGKLIESRTEHIVMGEASDGMEGLDMIMRFKPDLVITDIRMPKMDGLEMIRELYERGMPVHAVILSGYSEFHYAQRAIQYGVDDYLLKPLAADDVEAMLKKVEERIKKEQLANGAAELHIRNLILGEEKKLEEHCGVLTHICGLPEEAAYTLFVGYIGSATLSYREELEHTVEELKTKYSEVRIYYIYMDNQQKAYVIACGEAGGGKLSDMEKSFYNRMLLKYQNISERAIWAKQRFERLNNLKEIALELANRFSCALVLTPKSWLEAEDVNRYCPRPFVAPTEIYSRIRNAVCQSDELGIKKSTDDFLNYMEQGHFEAEEVRRTFIKSYYLIGDTVRDIDQSLYRHLQGGNHLRNIENAVTWHELETAYRDVVQVLVGTKVKREDISNFVIKKAINYIREHYSEGLTLDEVSHMLEITPEYLSTLFNREMEINFSTFLKQFRLSHAKRLLKGTNMKIYEVASKTGYNDPKYFQRVFKEELGVSPGEYRQMNQEGL